MYTAEMCQNITPAHIQEPRIALARAKTFRELHNLLSPYLYRSEAGRELLEKLKTERKTAPDPVENMGVQFAVKSKILFGACQKDLSLVVRYVADEE